MKKNESKKKWTWVLKETIDPSLSKEDIKTIVNKKIAHIIIELEHNPVSYLIKDMSNSNKN